MSQLLQSQRPKRPRALQACEVCRIRKNRCNEELPCIYCLEHDLECSYSRPQHREKRQRPKSFKQASNSDHDGADVDAGSTGPFPAPTRLGVGMTSDPFSDNTPSVASTAGTDDPGSATWTARPGATTPRGSVYEASDVMDTNQHTRNLEFYGKASSVALLRHVESISDSQTAHHAPGQPPSARSLASLLHNPDFRPHTTPNLPVPRAALTNTDHFYFRVARKFLDAYFGNIHHIQPIFDEDVFLGRCEDLWFGRVDQQPQSFVALYYATLSLGSLVMIWDDRSLYGRDRYTWSRSLFNEAIGIVTQLGTATDVEMVQCYYMMSKVCQHELNPHVAYLYSGQAARTALAIGINRRPIEDQQPSDPRTSISASKTWWAVYCLDIQTAFALGRPDSLGPDEYHSQILPTSATPTASASSDVSYIVPCMVDLSRLMRRVGLELYSQPCGLGEKIRRARRLDADVQQWLDSLPPQYRRARKITTSGPLLRPRTAPNHIFKQFVVLKLRYLNLRMIMHGAFMNQIDEDVSPDLNAAVQDCRQICIDSAGQSIDLMYDTFRTDSFFQTWWYNATYALFAVSTLLAAIFDKVVEPGPGVDDLFGQIDRAVAVLEAMEECVVARKSTEIVKRTVSRAKRMHHSTLDAPPIVTAPVPILEPDAEDQGRHQAMSWPNGNGSVPCPTTSDATAMDATSDDLRGDGATLDGGLAWSIANYAFDDPSAAAVATGVQEMYAFEDNGQQNMFWEHWGQTMDALGT